jgi:hypothetical protein
MLSILDRMMAVVAVFSGKTTMNQKIRIKEMKTRKGCQSTCMNRLKLEQIWKCFSAGKAER